MLLINLNKINAGEITHYLKEKKFEYISDQNQRVNTKFSFNEIRNLIS